MNLQTKQCQTSHHFQLQELEQELKSCEDVLSHHSGTSQTEAETDTQ